MPRSDLNKKPQLQGSRFASAETEPLTCARWMTSRLYTVKPRDSVAHARALLQEHRVNQLPVVRNGVLVGIVTDRDLRDAVNAVTTSVHLSGTVEPAPQTADQIPVETVMTSHVITLAPHSTMIAAAELMRRKRSVQYQLSTVRHWSASSRAAISFRHSYRVKMTEAREQKRR